MGVITVKLPDIGEGIHEGEIVKWLVRPGDAVEEDAPLVEVQTDKAVTEIPSPVAGTVQALLADEGAVVAVGTPLVRIAVPGAGEPEERSADEGGAEVRGTIAPEEAAPAPERGPAGRDGRPEAGRAEEASDDGAAAAPPSPGAAAAVRAMPSVRRLARERGVDLRTLKGSGPGGRITREDVLRAAKAKDRAVEQASTEKAPEREAAPEPAAAAPAAVAPREAPARVDETAPPGTPDAALTAGEERVPLRGVRRVIAEAMVRAKRSAPHVTLMDEADAGALVSLRRALLPEAEARGIKLTYLPFVVKAVVAALKAYPEVNAYLDEARQEIVKKRVYHIGIAVDAPQGLVVPVVFDADRKNGWEIAREIQDLAARAREGRLKPQELRGSTFSISNLGAVGGGHFTPILNPPEAAILGLGRVAEKPVVRSGLVQVGQVLDLSLSFDHRVLDGATAQRFLNHLKRLLENPQALFMEG
ncbi:MAG: 2-oxo acid dehydrogenase subunit E2 [Hydrogenibacillus schlegelii]|nr:2-oxo acid dehydrogenase subunit E2 [Hydrogenibacillus schlegelii]